MAHGLRYYKEMTHDDGKVVRLEILEKDYTGASMEIGPVCQALRLDIQGDTEIDVPIVKTSLTMAFVDAPDHADAKIKKCGNWQEFYTSDATKWQVVIKVKKEAGLNFVTMWGGYITPDSYNEVLTYRGSVTIVARDNIGHMNDFPFDAEGDANGMISMRDVIGGAWAKIESPMSLRLYYDDWMLTNDVVAYDTMMNVSAFEGKSWGEAVEMVLFAYGATLRYVGYNDVAIRPLRWIPLMGAAQGEAVKAIEPTFISGAERELVPAVRRVEENVDYDVEGTVSDKVDVSDFVGSTEDVWILGNESNSGGIVYPIVNKTRGRGWCNPADSLFFNPYPYSFLDGKEEDRGFTWLTCNTAESSFSRYAEYSLYAKPDNINLYCKFGPSYSLGAPERLAPADSLLSCLIAVAVEQNGITSYLTNEGEWVSEPTRLEKDLIESPEFNLPIPLVKYSGAVLLRVLVLQVKTTATYRDAVNYVPLYSLALGCDKPMLEKNGVNTNYNDENNVILSREPKIAPALNDVAFTRFIKNGIFTADGSTFLPTKRWAWPGTTPQQMAVYNHLQLLCYHAKPNNVLRGTIVNADLSDLRVIWMWHGAEHMLVSGSINYLNGHLENAVLREFARYEDMWGMLAPADLPDVEGNSSTNVEGGASSGSKGASITNRTEVYIGGGGGSITLDSYMSETSENGVMNRVIKAYVDDVRNDLTDLWRLEDGKVVTDKPVTIYDNLVVAGDVASSATGENSPVGIQGIKLNGQTYTDYDGDGVIDLGEIGGGDLDIGTLEAYLTDNKYVTESALNGYATQSWVNNQGFAKASALNGYLPLSGGTLESNTTSTVLNIKGSTNAWIGYYGQAGYLGEIGYIGRVAQCTDANGNAKDIIHAGNIGSHAVLLDGGGTITRGNLIMSSTASDVVTNKLYPRADNTYELGQYSRKWSVVYGVNGNFSGNVGIGVDTPQYKLDVLGNARLYSSDTTARTLFISNTLNDLQIGVNSSGVSYLFSSKGYDMGFSTNGTRRMTIKSDGNVEIAKNLIVAGDVASGGAGQETTAYLPLSGGTIDGNLTLNQYLKISAWSGYGSGTANVWYNGSTKRLLWENATDMAFGTNLVIHTGNIGSYAVTASGSTGMNATAFLTWGTELASTDLGDWNSIVSSRGLRIITSITAVSSSHAPTQYATGLHVKGRYGFQIAAAGGAADTFYMRRTNSSDTWRTLIHNGNISQYTGGSDIRYKSKVRDVSIDIEAMVNAPFFDFYWMREDMDKDIHSGTSAQYWEMIHPSFVSGTDFKALNYGALGVAMGISLAKKVKELEAEIKRLKGVA